MTRGRFYPVRRWSLASENLIGEHRTLVTNDVGVFRLPSFRGHIYRGSLDARLRYRPHGEPRCPPQYHGYGQRHAEDCHPAETITVVGESPVLDVTQSGSSTSFKNEMLEELPTERNMYDLMQVVPGYEPTMETGSRTVWWPSAPTGSPTPGTSTA